ACLRFFTVYGPRQRPDLAIHRFTSLIAQGQPVRMHGDGSSERDYTYITDCVNGVLSAVEWTARPRTGGRSEPLNIGGGARVRLDRLIELIGRTLGLSVRIERHADHPGDVRLTAADLRRAERELGYRPKIGIEALIHRGIVLNELGREAEADVAFRRAAQVGGESRQGLPAHVAAKLANQHAALGDAYDEAGALPQAIDQYHAALALGPAFHDLRYKLGRMLLHAGRALDAREHFEIIVRARPDRKSTRLNSSHRTISYAVFCLKKKKKRISH